MTKAESLLPLVVGITGHRDLRPEYRGLLADEIRKVFVELKKYFPNTPLILLTPLAEGADRLAAEVALEGEIGAKIIAPLPLPRDLFEKDFGSLESLRDFRNYLNRPEVQWFELPIAPGSTLEHVSTPGPARDLQYARGGAYVVQHCQILIALWDGKDSGFVGGTAQVVGFKLDGVPKDYLSEYSPADPLELGPVVHIHTPRASANESLPSREPTKILFPSSQEFRSETDAKRFYYDQVLVPLDAFNSLPTGAPPGLGQSLVDYKSIQSLASENLRRGLSTTSRIFSRADELAIYYRKKTYSTLFILSFLVALAALALDGSGLLPEEHAYETLKYFIMLLSPVLIVIAFLVYLSSKKQHFQDRHQDYRALAEGLRVQFFWQLCGIRESVASRYLGRLRRELYWIRRGCQTARMLCADLGQASSMERVKLALEYWIKDQLNYFSRKSRLEHHKFKTLKMSIKSFFWASLALTFVISLVGLLNSLEVLPEAVASLAMSVVDHHKSGHAVLEIIVLMGAICAALTHNYITKSAIEAHAKQYHRMERIFKKAATRLEALIERGDLESAKSALLTLGDEALAENGDWVLTHRERPVDVPRH